MATVRLEDMRVLGYCARGGREFCDRHGFDWRDFLHNGIDEALLEATGDGMASRAIEQAKIREAEL